MFQLLIVTDYSSMTKEFPETRERLVWNFNKFCDDEFTVPFRRRLFV